MVALDRDALLEITLADLLPVLEEKAAAGGCPLCPSCTSDCEQRARELLTPRANWWARQWQEEDPATTLAGLIDHTQLKAQATVEQIEALCREAQEHRFASVCVNPRYVPLCAWRLEDTAVLVCTVAGFPLGATTPEAKAFEAQQATAAGAREVDMVLAIGALKSGDDDAVEEGIAAVVETCHRVGAHCKVIIEAVLLDDGEKVRACRLAAAAGADFVKTSTGFAGGGATVYDVLLMRHIVGESVGVKAAGGIGTLADAAKMLVSGANRIGASAGVRLVQEAQQM